jgi:hypothetical protein
VIFLVTNGVKAVAKQFGVVIDGKGSVLVAALAAACVLLAQAAFSVIPEEFKPLATGIVSAVVLLLTAAGVYKTVPSAK